MTHSTQKRTFDSVGRKLVGTIYLPNNFSEKEKYKTVVMTPPAHQVKEQTLGVYGPKLAEKGFIAFAFDYNTKGESEGYKSGYRNDENAFRKHEDLRNAISYLRSLNYVDHDQFFGLGICGGGNIMSSVAITDLRIKAFASVSAMLATDAMFYSDKETFKTLIEAANTQRQLMYNSQEALNTDLFGYDNPNYLSDNPNLPPAQAEGYDYYGTERAGTAKFPRFSNHVLANIYESATVNIGEQYADKMLQPYIGIVGEKAETAFATKAFYDKVASEKEYVVIDGASHVDLYDKAEYVDQAINQIAQFFAKLSLEKQHTADQDIAETSSASANKSTFFSKDNAGEKEAPAKNLSPSR